MPVVSSTYKGPPFFLFNGHLETIFPSIYRKVKGVSYRRERIETPDNDFLDIDWLQKGNRRLLVVSHGLEGNSDRHYVTGMAKLFSQKNWDVLAWNNRSCSGEMNRQKILYHHGASYDLRTVVEHVNRAQDYDEIHLVGISLGGGQTLRYLGEWETFPLPENIIAGVAVSVPCSLVESAATLSKKGNWVYEKKFVDKLKIKIRAKAKQYPEIDLSDIENINTTRGLDNRYTAPIHGFQNANDFYNFCNPFPFLKRIKHPVYILNALNDPLLQGDCYPENLAKTNSNIHLEMPKRGGHVGYLIPGEEFTYAEKAAFRFLEENTLSG